MSGSFWRFGNNYSEDSTIHTLLKKSFIPKESIGNVEGEQKHPTEKLRSNSSSSSDSDSFSADFDFKFAHDDDQTRFNRNENYTPNMLILNDLLDEQNLLDEIAQSNTELIEYLKHRDILKSLIDMIVSCEDDEHTDAENLIHSDSESEEMSNQNEFKETLQEAQGRRAQVAAEILSADSWSLTDSFMDNSDLLGELWGILDKPFPLSMVLSTYFMKINEHLLDMKLDEMLNFLLHQDTLVDRFLKHIDNPPLMDFLLKVISTDKPDNPTGIVILLKEQQLVPKLIDFLDPSVVSNIQSAAADFIKAFVTISANSNTDNTTIGPNELTRELVSETIMEKLSHMMLNGGASLSNGVSIIIEIIRKNNSDYDFVPVLYITIESHPPNSRDPIYLGHLIKVFQQKIPQFTKLLNNAKTPDLETPFGKIEPLGFERFRICELIAELLHCSNMGLLNDASGEEIVHERDLERERIIALEKQQQDEFQDELDKEASRNLDRLSISSRDETQKIDNDHEHREKVESCANEGVSHSSEGADSVFHSSQSDNIAAGVETYNGKQEISEGNEIEVSKQAILESEPDSDDVDATLEMKYDDQELDLRRDPVVGDLLKIALADNQVILIILQMFFKFPWNNFLHNVVFDIVQQILNGSMEIGYNKYLAIDLFGRGAITQLIIDGQQKCDDYETETGLRLGYMGHLTLISEEVVKFTALYPPATIHQVILDAVSTEQWTIYVTETLVETREKYNALLGGVPEDEEEENDDSVKMQLDPNIDHDIIGSGADVDENIEGGDDKFSRYMSQELTNDLPDKFGSSDEDDEEDMLVGWENPKFNNQGLPEDDDEDDYVDPNDDGQSYTRKNHPLYNNLMSPDDERTQYMYGGGDDDSSSSSSSDEEGRNYEDEEDKGYTLTRTKSNGELNWADDD